MPPGGPQYGEPPGGPRGGETLRLPGSGMPPGSAMPPGTGRPRRSRKKWFAIGIPLVLLILLIGADRIAAAYAASQIASRVQGYGFPVKPDVSVEGFPFLTQVIAKHLDGIDISSPSFPAGPVTASLTIRASDISLNSGYSSGTIGHITGTGLISFGSIAQLADKSGGPGVKVTRAGPHTIKLSADLDVIQASAIARVKQTGPRTLSIRIVSTDGIPASVLGPIRHFTVHIPKLPAGITVQSVSVTSDGVSVRVTGSNIPFTN
jgi:hypothetical protein